MSRAALLLALAALAIALAGCGSDGGVGSPRFGGGPGGDDKGLGDFGSLSVATRATTRLGGADPETDAASVASAVFPATSPATRPSAVTLVDKRDWQGAVAASALAARPIGAPILLSDGGDLPEVTEATLKRLRPKGSDLSGDAQVIRVGARPPVPKGFKDKALGGTDPYATAAAVDTFSSAVRGRPSDDVVVTSGEDAAYAMPAAAWAARSGDSVLFARRDAVPPATAKALRAHEKPRIFVLGPESVIGERVERSLRGLGRVQRIAGATPADNAVEFARFQKGGFGWGVRRPGYNFTLASTSRPTDAGGSAALATNGIFAPLLVTDSAEALPRAVESYLLDVQPGYDEQAPPASLRSGVFNRVWILGDAEAVSAAAQTRLDQVTGLVPIQVRRRP